MWSSVENTIYCMVRMHFFEVVYLWLFPLLFFFSCNFFLIIPSQPRWVWGEEGNKSVLSVGYFTDEWLQIIRNVDCWKLIVDGETRWSLEMAQVKCFLFSSFSTWGFHLKKIKHIESR